MSRPRILAALAVLAVTFAALPALAVRVGARAPALRGTDLDGHSVNISSLRGHVVVVDFWGSWCEPCAEELPFLQRLYTSRSGRGLRVLGVSQDRTDDAARTFASRFSLTFPNLVDGGSHPIAHRWGATSLPASMIVDCGGIVRFVHTSYRSRDASTIESEVDGLIASCGD